MTFGELMGLPGHLNRAATVRERSKRNRNVVSGNGTRYAQRAVHSERTRCLNTFKDDDAQPDQDVIARSTGETIDIAPGAKSAGDTSEPAPMSAPLAMLMCCIRPAATTQRTARWSLKRAFACHAVAFLFAVMAITFLNELGTLLRHRDGRFTLAAGFADNISDFFRDCARNPEMAFAVIGGTILAVEIGAAVMALLLAPWGAGDEPVRSSIGHAFRRVWLQSCHLALAILLAGSVIVVLESEQTRWHMILQAEFEQTTPLPHAPPNATKEETAAFQQEIREYHQAARQYSREQPRPFWIRNAVSLMMACCLIVCTWYLVFLMRAVAAPRRCAFIERDPLCRMCGYILHGQPLTGQCPECGQPVEASRGEGASIGSAWDRRAELGWFASFIKTSWIGLIRPNVLGRRLMRNPPAYGYRSFFLIHLVLAAPLAAVGICACFVVEGGWERTMRDREFVLIVIPMLTGLSVLTLVALVGTCSLIAGLTLGTPDKRNNLSCAMQAASYGAAFLHIWVIASFGSLALLLRLDRSIRESAQSVHFGSWELMMACWLLVELACVVCYLLIVFKGTRGLRYAN